MHQAPEQVDLTLHVVLLRCELFHRTEQKLAELKGPVEAVVIVVYVLCELMLQPANLCEQIFTGRGRVVIPMIVFIRVSAVVAFEFAFALALAISL